MLKVALPSDVGRIARKISNCYKSLKADEWKYWTLVYSMFALRGILSPADLRIWCLFVNACSLLCRRSITNDEVNQAHELLKFYFKQFESKYGKNCCVPNMHLALHLKKCILDYGSVYGFWCFSFERYNGILGRYHTNNHAITIQLMRKLVMGSQLYDQEASVDLNEFETSCEALNQFSLFCNKQLITGFDLEFQFEKILSVPRKLVLEKEIVDDLTCFYQRLYPCEVKISTFARKLTRVEFNNQTLASNSYRGGNSPYAQIVARYPNVNQFDAHQMVIRPALITSIIEVLIVRIEGNREVCIPQIVVLCRFFKETNHKNHFGINSPLKLWSTELEHSTYLPVKLVCGRFVCCKEELTIDRLGNRLVPNSYNLIIRLPSKSVVG